MKKLFLLLAVIFSTSVFAQTDDDASEIVDGIVKKEHIVNKRHMNHAFVREANVLWSKTVWRMVDLREKRNQRLYFPTTNFVDGRRSLVKVLIDGITTGDVQAYDPNNGPDDFDTPLSVKEVFSSIIPQMVKDELGDSAAIERGEESFDYESIVKLLIKEVWFFDRKYSRLDVRILGITAVREYEESNVYRQSKCFTVYFPQVEQLLSEQEVFNDGNDAQRESIHDVLMKREFTSYVFQESNVNQNRALVEKYTNGIDQNIEAEKIDYAIFKKEHDMWEF